LSQKIHGNTQGLNARQLETLEKLYRRRNNPNAVVSIDFAHRLTYPSEELNRKIAVLVDRRGRVEDVIVGDAHRVYLPDVGRQRVGRSRLRGLRLITTNVTAEHDDELLTRDELTDLRKLRLDMVVSVRVEPGGHPGAVEYAYVLPSSADDPYDVVRQHNVGELDLDYRKFIKALEDELGRTADRTRRTDEETAILVHLDTGERDADAREREMLELCRTAGVDVVEVVHQRRRKPDHRYVVGSGKIEEVELLALDYGADFLIFDRDLSPAQVRAISERTDLKVIDRTQLILDIFAQRARSHDGKLQVELAQLKYALPKLIQKNTAMSRLTGGIGGRGPGETKLEVNRRRARDRINRLEKRLEKLSQQRALRRSRRNSRAVPVVSLVGYTNAGKSTLLNTLTNANVLSEDKLFATLDPTSRRLRCPDEREIVLTDTVGFIRDLPQDLVAAFKATLEELDDADVLLHIVDAASGDVEHSINTVEEILNDLDLGEIPRILVFNKSDLLDENEAAALAEIHGAIPISALDAGTTQPLLDRIDEVLWRRGAIEPDERQQEHRYDEDITVRQIDA